MWLQPIYMYSSTSGTVGRHKKVFLREFPTYWQNNHSIYVKVYSVYYEHSSSLVFFQVAIPWITRFLLFHRYFVAAGLLLPDGTGHVHHHRLLHQHAVLRCLRPRLPFQWILPGGSIRTLVCSPKAREYVPGITNGRGGKYSVWRDCKGDRDSLRETRD